MPDMMQNCICKQLDSSCIELEELSLKIEDQLWQEVSCKTGLRMTWLSKTRLSKTRLSKTRLSKTRLSKTRLSKTRLSINCTESGMTCILYVKVKKSFPETITLQKMLGPQTVVY